MGLITTGGVEVGHCPFVGGCGCLCISMGTHAIVGCGGVLITVCVGVIVGLVIMVGGDCLWAVDRFIMMGGCGMLGGGHSGCWLWLQVCWHLLPFIFMWFLVITVWVLVIGCGCCLSVAGCGYWCSWAVVVCY